MWALHRSAIGLPADDLSRPSTFPRSRRRPAPVSRRSRAVGGRPASLPRTEPGTGIYDYRSRRDPMSAGERTDLLPAPQTMVSLDIGAQLRGMWG